MDQLMSSRLDRLRVDIERAGESAFLVTEGKNRRYLSGFTGSSGWLLVTGKSAYLLTDGRYWEQVERQCPNVELFRYIPSEHKTLSGALSSLIEQLGFGAQTRMGIELDDMPVALYRNLASTAAEQKWELTDVEGRIKEYRVVKDSEELEALRRAATIADRAFQEALNRFEIGQSEARLKAEIDYQVLRGGGEGASFPTIVASGIQGSFPHAGATEKPILEGELVTIDFGAIWNGYCSDMTRTVWWGPLSERDKGLVERVTEAQQRSVKAARPGLTTGDLDEVARAYLRENGLGDYFIHSLGHGVGLDIHEAPSLRSGQSDLLVEGQVITLEPGVYLPGQTGCRIEDTVVLRADGPVEVLNRSPKQRIDQTHPQFYEN